MGDTSEEKVSLFLWRYRTKWVAWIDIAKLIVEYLVIITIAIVTVVAFYLEREKLHQNIKPGNNSTIRNLSEALWQAVDEVEEDLSDYYTRIGLLYYIWLSIALVICQLACFFGLKIISLVKLLRSTQKNSDPNKTRKQAQFWTYVGIGHLIIETLSVFLMEPGYLLVFQLHMIILSMELLYLVHRFGWELKVAIKEKKGSKVDVIPNAPSLSELLPPQEEQIEDSLFSLYEGDQED